MREKRGRKGGKGKKSKKEDMEEMLGRERVRKDREGEGVRREGVEEGAAS